MRFAQFLMGSDLMTSWHEKSAQNHWGLHITAPLLWLCHSDNWYRSKCVFDLFFISLFVYLVCLVVVCLSVFCLPPHGLVGVPRLAPSHTRLCLLLCTPDPHPANHDALYKPSPGQNVESFWVCTHVSQLVCLITYQLLRTSLFAYFALLIGFPRLQEPPTRPLTEPWNNLLCLPATRITGLLPATLHQQSPETRTQP